MIELIFKTLLGLILLVGAVIGFDSLTTGKFLIPSVAWAGWVLTICYFVVGVAIIFSSFLEYFKERKFLADYRKNRLKKR